MRGDFWIIAIRGVFAGWLIALMVWVPPSAGSLRLGSAVLGYLLPTLLGNVVGGVSFVAALNHAQVKAGGPPEG